MFNVNNILYSELSVVSVDIGFIINLVNEKFCGDNLQVKLVDEELESVISPIFIIKVEPNKEIDLLSDNLNMIDDESVGNVLVHIPSKYL